MENIHRHIIQQLHPFPFSAIILFTVLIVISTLSFAAEPRQIKRSPQLKNRSVQPRLILRPMRTDVAAVKALVKRRVVLPRISGKDQRVLHAIVHDIKQKRLSSAKKRWHSLAQGLARSGKRHDANALIQWVIYQSSLETSRNLQYYASKVRYYKELKNKLREEIADMRDSYADYAGRSIRVNKIVRMPTYRPGATPSFDRATTMMTKEQLAAYIQNLGGMLSTIGNELAISQLKLQRLNQQMSQAFAKLSTMMKSMHDTLKAIINNMRA